ncbi:MAG: DUF72 domain-containing protein [Planctomycetota bacterium]|jgi:uncharacterized protein YecE (DUF72 family)
MRIPTGTSGFSYKEWKGSFYADKIKDADMLAFYASKLEAVEINNTFYRMPRASVLEGWADKVPATFRFTLKASRRISHDQRLRETTADSVRYLFELARVLRRAGLGRGLRLLQARGRRDRAQARAGVRRTEP